MSNNPNKQRRQKDPVVNVMLNGGRVTSGFRAALFAAASRAGVSVNEFVLTAAAEKLKASGGQFSGVFEPGDIKGATCGLERACITMSVEPSARPLETSDSLSFSSGVFP